MKKCSKCSKLKPNSEYNKRSRISNTLQSMCKICANKERKKNYKKNRNKTLFNAYKRNIKIRYGVSIEDYDAMLKKQKNKCAICESTSNNRKRAERFCIDHCHSTGKIRGLLCHNCNVLLGKLKDSIAMCKKVVIYLESF